MEIGDLAVTVRRAAADDVPAVARLQCGHTGEPVAEVLASVRAELTRNDRWLWVAVTGDVLLGYGRLSLHAGGDPGTSDSPGGYYLGGLVVDPDHRARGVGAALTEVRMRAAFERADEVWYFTNARNTASVALHTRFGFVEVGRGHTYLGVTFDGGQGILFRATRRSWPG